MAPDYRRCAWTGGLACQAFVLLDSLVGFHGVVDQRLRLGAISIAIDQVHVLLGVELFEVLRVECLAYGGFKVVAAFLVDRL